MSIKLYAYYYIIKLRKKNMFSVSKDSKDK